MISEVLLAVRLGRLRARRLFKAAPSTEDLNSPWIPTRTQTFYPTILGDPLKVRRGLTPVYGVPAGGLSPVESDLSSMRLEGRTLRLAVDPEDSAFGDCISVVDVPEEEKADPELPAFGWSGEQLLGGYAMTLSRLSGFLSIQFGQAAGGRIPFRLSSERELNGEDGELTAPDGYRLRTRENRVRDVHPRSRGIVELRTGRIFDFYYHVMFRNTALDLLLDHNPKLIPPPLLFPGVPHSGHALGWMSKCRGDTLELNIAAGMFLPMDVEHGGEPVRMPPSESGDPHPEPLVARNSSLHPYVFIRARESPSAENLSQGSRRRRSPGAEPILQLQNSQVELDLLPSRSYFGDDFNIHTTDLGGPASARSPLFGRVYVQFGGASNGKLPFVIRFDAPTHAFEAKQRRVLEVLPNGTSAGLAGMAGFLSFPRARLEQRDLAFFSDPYKLSTGFLDLESGETNSFVVRSFLFVSVLKRLMIIEPRTPSDSFAYLCKGRISAEPWVSLEIEGSVHVPYPSGYRFPMPGSGSTEVLEDSHLEPFVRIQAAEVAELAADISGFQLTGGALERGLGTTVERLVFDGDSLIFRLSGRRRSVTCPSRTSACCAPINSRRRSSPAATGTRLVAPLPSYAR